MTTALLGTTFIVISQYSTMYSSPKSTLKRSCQSYGNSLIAAVQQDTYYRQLNNFIPTNSTRTGAFAASPTNATTATVAIGSSAPYSNYWWAGSVPAADYTVSETSGASTNGTILQNFQLIQGTIRELAAIYNNDATVRCAFGTYAPLTTLPMPADLTRAVTGVASAVQIRIAPYNAVTGASACASFPTKVHPAPQGLQPSANGNMYSAFSVAPTAGDNLGTVPATNEEWATGSTSIAPAMPTGYKMANRGAGTPVDNNATDAVGFELTIQVNYKENGNDDSCVVSQKFEYPRDRRAPPVPNIAVVTTNGASPALNRCSELTSAAIPTTESVTLRVGYDASVGGGGELERGTQFLCRDLSWRRTYLTPVLTLPTTGFVPCLQGGAIQNMSTLDLALPARTNELVNARNFTARVNQWVPCDKLVQCGSAPTSVVYNDGATARTNPNDIGTGIHQLVMNYATLPVGCVLNFETVAVDTAGNTSISGLTANRRFLETTSAGVDVENEVLPKTCGTNFCAADAVYPRGYYTCRVGGCCTGATCTVPANR